MKPQSLDAEPSLLKVGKVAVTEKSVLAARKYPKRKRGKVRYGDPEFRDETLTEFQKYEENLSDDNDETYKPDKKDKPTSESDEDTSNQLTIKAQTTSNQPPIKSQKVSGRTYVLWAEESKAAFETEFAKYLKQDRGYPAREVMERFAERFELSHSNVRTRIVNTRRVRSLKQKKLMKELGIKAADLMTDLYS
ncbi:uncharacterized protein LOC130612733 isoform X1 [Hydractinia symbiolongicarpus]|uniref:uncharacterized protein LOC130612733 isoform X1 n=1 Tax=Hydractinia symbiolongicarpus TaxID=13093 RepID=UPI00254A44F7|nr:uncharacterized protein LOC130612733 isoform X1 [Hydractinia symbiolongicarpus]